MSEQNSNLIRNYVDGELDGAKTADLERRIESDQQLQAQVRFEHLLRQRIDVVMRGRTGAVPEGLAERIRANLTEAATEPEPEIVVGRVDRRGAAVPTGRRRFWRAPRTNLLAMAAALALILTVVLVSIFSRTIGERSDLAIETVQFVKWVHGKCAADPEMLAAETPWREPAEAEQRLTGHLGARPVVVFDLSSLDFAFVGAGECHVPGTECSGHFFHRRQATDERRGVMVSLYVVPDDGQYDGLIEDFRTLEWFQLPGGEERSEKTCGLSDGSVIYFLVSGCRRDLEQIKETIAADLRRRVQ